jgi:hypothetical protein
MRSWYPYKKKDEENHEAYFKGKKNTNQCLVMRSKKKISKKIKM